MEINTIQSKSTNKRMETRECDLISRQVAIDAFRDTVDLMPECYARDIIAELPSAQPDKPISYMDCANAMMMMWMDKIITDGEYNRIMDRLNAKHKMEAEHE